jgi:3-hydroxyisobutyrate dehydrogenase-like beta-hydroxyacid dehydrogenase
MGSALACRLLAAGNELLAWNRTRSKLGPLVDQGAVAVDDLAGLAAAEIVFVTVSTPQDLEAVVGSLLGGAARPRIVVDCSTVSSAASAAVRELAAEAGVGFVAAPVSGNPHIVAEGRACIVASAPAETFGAVQGFLEQLAPVVVHAGFAEESRLVKLCHNLYLGMLIQALAEVTALAEKGGIDRAAFLEFLNGTVLACEWVQARTPDLVALDWTPTFTTELMRKDFDLGLAAARELEVPLPLGASVHQLTTSAINSGLRHQDFLSLYVHQARGSELGPRASATP